MFAIEGFHPKNEGGDTITHYKDANSALPLITFFISLFSSSFGTSKFLVHGPIQFISNDSALNGILSMPFLCLCILNTMFGFRIICIETAFFTSYRLQFSNDSLPTGWDRKEITALVNPEYRILLYLAPCIFPFLINAFKLFCTTRGFWKYYLQYPQFLISPCFTPFMFEGYKSSNIETHYRLKIWKLGTIVNAIYIGCVPQCILLIIDYLKGVHNWKFQKKEFVDGDTFSESNDGIFKFAYGNAIFAISTAVLFLALIIIFFQSKSLFRERGFHCKCFAIVCCPCPEDCINYKDCNLGTYSSRVIPYKSETEGKFVEQVGEGDEEQNIINQPHTELYLYTKKGDQKFLVFREPSNEYKKNNLSLVCITLWL